METFFKKNYLKDFPKLEIILKSNNKSIEVESSSYRDDSILLEFVDTFISNFEEKIILVNNQDESFIILHYVKLNNQIIVNIKELTTDAINYIGEWKVHLIVNIGNSYEAFTVIAHQNIAYPKKNCEPKEYVTLPIIDKTNKLSLLINQYIKVGQKSFQLDAQVKKIKPTNKGYQLKVVVLDKKAQNQMKIERIVLKLRNNSYSPENNLDIINIKKNQNRYTINLHINEFYEISTYWDLYAVAEINGNEVYIRVMIYNPKVEFILSSRISHFEKKYDNQYMLYPYVTLNKALSFTYRKRESYENKREKIKETLAFILAFLLKPMMASQKIWVIYGKDASEAQDNSFYFFKYLMNCTDKNNVYYVIKDGSPDAIKLEKFKKNTLSFMSFKYYFYLFSSSLLVASEFRMHVYSISIQKGLLRKSILRTPFVFLQHGVIGLKKVSFFSKKRENHADLFITASNAEKKIVVNQLFYNSNDVVVTGLARWDAIDLNEENKISGNDVKCEILLMPTWRSWLFNISEKEFKKTDYYRNYFNLINSKKILSYLDENNITLNFLLHPKFKDFSHLFVSNNSNIKNIYYGQEAVNNILTRCKLLITDYSSISWEALYRNIPTIFYQFDKKDYQKKEGSYIDLDKLSFGYNAENIEDILNNLYELKALQYKLTDNDIYYRENFFEYIDNNNCQRIYQEIKQRETNLTPPLLSKKNSQKQLKNLQIELQNVNLLRILLNKEKIWK